MKFYFIFLCSILYSSLHAQDNADLLSILEQIKPQIKEVPGKSDIYAQEIDWDESAPYKITFTQQITKKGKGEEIVYELSLRDVDKNTVKVKNDKDLMKVPVYIDNRQKMIKVFKEGKQEKYIEKLEIIAIDVDNARKLEELLEEAIQIANKIKLPGLPETFDDRIAWLTQNIVPVTIDETFYNQTIEQDDDLPMVIHYTLAKEKNKTSEASWQLNLGDLKDRMVRLIIKGKEVMVELQATKGQKFIQQYKEGEKDGYTDEFEIYVEDPQKGKMLEEVLKGVIVQAQEMEKKRFPEITDLQSGLDLLTEKVSSLEENDKSYMQTFEAACLTSLKQIITDSKGNSSEIKNLFDLADINANTVDIEISGKGVLLNLETGKDRLIQTFEDGDLKGYTNKISVYAKDVENAKWLLHTFPQTIKYCQERENDYSFSINGDSFEWIKQHIVEIENTRQELEKSDSSSCKWRFITTNSGKKSETEETYEFNLYDLNPKSIDLKISSKSLAIEISTKHNEKNIKYYKNGEPGDYKNIILIQMGSIAKARQMMKAWEKQIEACNE